MAPRKHTTLALGGCQILRRFKSIAPAVSIRNERIAWRCEAAESGLVASSLDGPGNVPPKQKKAPSGDCFRLPSRQHQRARRGQRVATATAACAKPCRSATATGVPINQLERLVCYGRTMTESSACKPPLELVSRPARAGFTLIEMSMVLVVIALAIGGVMAGNELVKLSKVRGVIGEQEKITQAFQTFRNKFDCLPGDCRKAGQFFPGVPGGNRRRTDCSYSRSIRRPAFVAAGASINGPTPGGVRLASHLTTASEGK